MKRFLISPTEAMTLVKRFLISPTEAMALVKRFLISPTEAMALVYSIQFISINYPLNFRTDLRCTVASQRYTKLENNSIEGFYLLMAVRASVRGGGAILSSSSRPRPAFSPVGEDACRLEKMPARALTGARPPERKTVARKARGGRSADAIRTALRVRRLGVGVENEKI